MLKESNLIADIASLSDIARVLHLARNEMDQVVTIAWKGSFDWHNWENDLIDGVKDGIMEKIHVYRENGNDIIAFSWITLELDSLWIDSLVVDKNYHRQGIGRSILEWLISEYVTPNRLKAVKLGVQKNNSKAIAFYRKMGFKRVAFIDKANTLIMEKSISYQ